MQNVSIVNRDLRVSCSLAVAVLLCMGAMANAATVTWGGGDMTWTQPDSDSWSGVTYVSGDTANFAGAGTGTVTVDAGGVTPGAVNLTSGTYAFILLEVPGR